ncbi:MAG: glycosyltransferase [Anaerolineae bacterium]|nr:glycosyltransferase [Anaerolineae bacterium]
MDINMGSGTKIAVIIGQLAGDGTERQLYSFLVNCDRSRWTPMVYVSGALGPWYDPICELGIPVILLQGNPVMKLWQFRKLCRSYGIRRFFSWSYYTNGYSLALLGLNIPCIGSYRTVYSPRLFSHYKRMLSRLGFVAVSTVVCNSQETAAAIGRQVGDRKRVIYVPNSVQPVNDMASCRTAWRQRLGISANEVLILGVGRLTALKNFARFIEAVASVHQTIPVRAVVAGRDDGCLRGLEQQIAEAGLEPGVIRFIGPVPDARELMSAADIFVLSSEYEGMPNVVMEAMIAGVPCVSTKVNGVGALIENGINGFITKHRAAALSEKILLLVKDKQLRENMGAKAAAHMKASFDSKDVAARLWQLCD